MVLNVGVWLVCEITKQQHKMPMLVDAPNLVMGGVDGIDTFNPIDLLGLSLQIICHFLQADGQRNIL